MGARLSGDVIVIPLTFGYHAVGPQFVGRDSGRPDALRAVMSACNPVMRASFGMLGIRQFMCLQVVRYG